MTVCAYTKLVGSQPLRPAQLPTPSMVGTSQKAAAVFFGHGR